MKFIVRNKKKWKDSKDCDFHVNGAEICRLLWTFPFFEAEILGRFCCSPWPRCWNHIDCARNSVCNLKKCAEIMNNQMKKSVEKIYLRFVWTDSSKLIHVLFTVRQEQDPATVERKHVRTDSYCLFQNSKQFRKCKRTIMMLGKQSIQCCAYILNVLRCISDLRDMVTTNSLASEVENWGAESMVTTNSLASKVEN